MADYGGPSRPAEACRVLQSPAESCRFICKEQTSGLCQLHVRALHRSDTVFRQKLRSALCSVPVSYLLCVVYL